MKKAILFFAMFFASALLAQNTVSNASNWKNELSVGFGVSQIAYSNWTRGGESHLSWTANLGGKFVYETSKVNWTTGFKMVYGRNKTGDGINKVTQNDFLFNSTFALKSDWIFDYYGGVNLITQIAPGYDYDAENYPQINDLFDPADLTESFGLKFSRGDNFSTQLGLGFHQVFSNEFNTNADDPETPDVEKVLYETGIESITTYKLEFSENLAWNTYLRFFSAFDRLDTWDVRWDNTIKGKVNSWLSVTFSWVVIYNVKETLRTQVKEDLRLGFSYAIL